MHTFRRLEESIQTLSENPTPTASESSPPTETADGLVFLCKHERLTWILLAGWLGVVLAGILVLAKGSLAAMYGVTALAAVLAGATHQEWGKSLPPLKRNDITATFSQTCFAVAFLFGLLTPASIAFPVLDEHWLLLFGLLPIGSMLLLISMWGNQLAEMTKLRALRSRVEYLKIAVTFCLLPYTTLLLYGFVNPSFSIWEPILHFMGHGANAMLLLLWSSLVLWALGTPLFLLQECGNTQEIYRRLTGRRMRGNNTLAKKSTPISTANERKKNAKRSPQKARAIKSKKHMKRFREEIRRKAIKNAYIDARYAKRSFRKAWLDGALE